MTHDTPTPEPSELSREAKKYAEAQGKDWKTMSIEERRDVKIQVRDQKAEERSKGQ